MKIFPKSVLVLALCAPSVMAVEYQFYGRFDYSLTHSDSGSATHNNKAGLVLENNFSRLGIKGRSELASNTEIFYQIEVGVNGGSQDKTSNPFSSRPTYLGIRHQNYGSLAFGRIDPVFKMAKGTVDAMDMYSLKHDRLFAGDKRWGDSLEYKSPKWQKLQLGVSYLLEDNYYKVGDQRRDLGNYQVAVTYGDKFFKSSDLYLAAAYSDGMEDVRAYRGVVQYRMDALTLGTMIQHSELVNESATQWQQRDGIGFITSAKYALGAWLFKAEVGYDDSGTGVIANRLYKSKGDLVTAVPEVSQWAIGAEYKLSKSARIHSELGQFDVKQHQDFDDTIVSLGFRYDF
ncbi:porin [Shewanella sp. NIFS-20-20]|uniref:porin n=1 Tax=Shewanella sp. NIFS-20-20 TaxID=2853806 RepID=UPI001C48BB39|nr:porin [Shewanella sp. NIFS-20-20]MBV7314640.1 porin [Shewanella sp. NIFS-20-20]